jgi:hypothetical protein
LESTSGKTLTMGLLNAGLAAVTVGYILGGWTACVVSASHGRRAHSAKEGSMFSMRSIGPALPAVERQTMAPVTSILELRI